MVEAAQNGSAAMKNQKRMRKLRAGNARPVHLEPIRATALLTQIRIAMERVPPWKSRMIVAKGSSAAILFKRFVLNE